VRRRHPAGSPVALVIGALVLLSPVAAGAATTSVSAPSPSSAPSTPPSAAPSPAPAGPTTDAGLEVTSFLPAELLPGGRVTVRGRVTAGAAGLVGARVEVRRATTRGSSVSSLERWTAAVGARTGPAAGQDPFGDPAATARTEVVVELGDLPPGTVTPFTATLDAADLGLRPSAGAAGAYGLQLLLLDGSDGSGGTVDRDGEEVVPVDDERGFLLWSPATDVAPTRLMTTVALQGPAPDAGTGLPDPGELAATLAPGGRLERLLTAATVLAADWVVDPVLLAAAAVAADSTTAEAEAGPADAPTDPAPTERAPAEPDDAAVAAAWLAALAAGRDGRDVVLGDWADPDPARLRSADDVDRAWATVRAAQEAALPDDSAEQLLGGSTRSDVLLHTDGGLTGPDLLTLAQGRRSVVMPEVLVPLSDPSALTFTPDAVTEVTVDGETFTAVLDDASLTADVVSAIEGSPLALTRVLARLATTTLQRPNDPRLLAVALPPDLTPEPGGAEELAAALAATGWATTVPLATALGTPPSDAAREPLPTDRDAAVPGVQDLLDAVADGRRVEAAVTAPADPVAVAALDLRAAATLSRSAERGASTELAARLREQTRGTVDAVQVVPGSRVTLVATQAALPVTVVNDLDTEVNLVLEVRSRSPRLQVPQTLVPVAVQPGQLAVVDVPVVAVASGPAEVSSQLMTTDGRAWGPGSAITVTVATQAEERVLTGVGIGVAVLFVLGAARAFVLNRRGRELVGSGPVEP